MEQCLHHLAKKIFISHSSKDVAYVELIINLLEDIGLTEDQVVCSSVPGYGIPLGKDIYEWLAEQFRSFDLHVLFVLSHNYYNSVACLNEMGAAWVLKTRYDSILLPDFSFSDIEGAVNPNQISVKLDCENDMLKEHLNQLKDSLVKEFNLNMPSASKWERHRDGFIQGINKVIEDTAVENDETQAEQTTTATLSMDAGELLVNAANDDSGRIMRIPYCGGLILSTNGRGFIPANAGPREEARWKGALDELESYGLIEAASYKREVFTVTHEGYRIADEIGSRFPDVMPNKSEKSMEEFL